MMSSTNYYRQSGHNLVTLDVFDAGNRFIIEERSKHCPLRLIVEVALCVVVGVMLLGSFLLLILPEFPLVNHYFGVSLSMVMVGIALSLYVFATRGFKPQVGYDKLKKQFWVCKLNSKGHARIVTYYAQVDVQSVFIRRPKAPSKEAALNARIKGKHATITLLRGHLDDIEAAHHALCEASHSVEIVRPVRPVLKAKFGGARAMRGFQADTV